MAKLKIYELKNEINDLIKGSIESKDILDYLENSFGVKKSHSSALEDNEVQVIKNHFVRAAQAAAAKPSGASAPARTSSSATASTTKAHTGQHAAGSVQSQSLSQAPATQSQTGASHNQTAQRPVTQGGARTATPTDRPAGQQGMARPAGQGQKPAMGQQQIGTRQGHPGQTGSGQRPAGDQVRPGMQTQSVSSQAAHTGQQGVRPAGGQSLMKQGQQGYQGQGNAGQGYQGSGNTGRPGDHTQGQRTGAQGTNMQQGQRPQRPAGDNAQGNQRYQGNQGQRPQGEGYQRQQGGYGNRSQGDGYRPRPQGEGYQGQGGYGNRSQGDGYRPRPQGEGYQGQGGYGNRSQGDGYRPRPQGEGYQGQGGYGNRSQGDGYRPRPQGEGYQRQGDGNRPQGDGYRSRPQGEGYQRQGDGNRPQGDGYRPRPQGEGYQGQQGGYGNRSQGGPRPGGAGGQQGRGNYGGQGGFNRPSGGGQRPGGFGSRGFEDMGKDDDDKPSYGNRTAGKKPAGRGGSERKNFDQQILDQKVAEKNDNSNKRNRDRINKEKNYKDRVVAGREDENDDEIKKILPKKGQFIQPKPVQVVEEEIKVISIPEVLTIKELADKMKKPSAQLIKKLFLAGKIVTLNQEITFEEAEEIALDYEIIAEKEVKVNEVEELLKEEEEDPSTMEKRPPVVCVMGHVDHGKTSLLDAIRESNVTSREAGGITQHIGAYVVEINNEKITFLDTPGHEAFTAMRKRGAKSTDIAILVVAADDGVMPQTVEAINHAKAAGVQIIVAINKIDKPSANIERVKQELTEYELIAEDWGGDTIFVPVSAHTKEGISQLLEMILLTAEMVELKANPNRNARGIVIEAELDKGRGPVATILVQKGTLRVGDNVAVGSAFGKVRAMNDDKGRRVKEATPSTPVEILGLNEVPDAGETLLATNSEKEARAIADAYLAQSKEKLLADTKAKLSLDGLFSQIQAGNIKELNLIIKADVQGSVEAMKQSLLKLSNKEVAVRVLHGGVGAINESDVILASTSNAIIIGFNVKPDNAAKETADREKVDVKLYRVIYNAINDIEAAMKGMLDPIFEERIIGHAEIRMTFKASGVGTIAGSYVLDGKIIRGSKARIYRDNTLIYDGTLASLKRFQDDVKEVATGYECGLVFEKFNDVKEGDKVELYIMAEVPR
jgi:translation initiation factor IF-2